MSFRLASSLVALVCLILFFALLIAPQLYTPTYGVAADAGAQFMTRRASPMFLGFAVIFWLSRGSDPSAARDAIIYGGAAAFVGVALTGVFAWTSGVASFAILIAAILECALAAVLLVSKRN